MVRMNPELLILASANPGPRECAATWRKLVRRYGVTRAAGEYVKIYPSATHTVRLNTGGPTGRLGKNPEFRKALAKFREFHGCEPTNVLAFEHPDLRDGTVLVIMGRAPAESYDANGVIRGSNKAGSTWVHPYGRRPLKAMTADGRTIMTLPGNFKVTDFIRDSK